MLGEIESRLARVAENATRSRALTLGDAKSQKLSKLYVSSMSVSSLLSVINVRRSSIDYLTS